MKNTRWIMCFDFETDWKDPLTCNPVELAAVPITPDTLEIKKDLAFNVVIKPPGIDDDSYFTDDRNSTINWHAEQRGCTPGEIIDKWKQGVPEKIAWKNFSTYCSKYNVAKRKGQWYPQPVSTGMNIHGFDLPICKRLCETYKVKMPISDVAVWDVYNLLQMWFENLPEPENLKMDTLRSWLGMPEHGGAHEALPDVYDTAEILTRFLRFMRKQSSVAKFKGSFKKS